MARSTVGVTSPGDGSANVNDHQPVPERELPEVTANIWTKLGEGGRVVIPAEIRQILGLKPGGRILLRVEDGELHLLTTRQAIKRAQDLARPFVRPGVSVVDELIADRRAEAVRE